MVEEVLLWNLQASKKSLLFPGEPGWHGQPRQVQHREVPSRHPWSLFPVWLQLGRVVQPALRRGTGMGRAALGLVLLTASILLPLGWSCFSIPSAGCIAGGSAQGSSASCPF